MEKVGDIGSNGLGRIKLDISYHTPFLISHKPGTQEFVPFALDYKKTAYFARMVVAGFLLAIPAIGLPGDGDQLIFNIAVR